MRNFTESDKKLLNDIEEYGWHVVKVMEDETGPSFSYSVGLYNSYKHPEIIIIGLPMDLAHGLINDIGELIKKGQIFTPGSQYSDIIANHACQMLSVDRDNYEGYVNYAIWYYKNSEFPVIQCVYPAANGSFPWEASCPEKFRTIQPIIGTLK